MRAFLATLVALSAAISHADELHRLRAAYAAHFLDVHAHLRLSQHLLERGDALSAFFVTEAARRGYFDDATFDPAFRAVFRNDRFDNSPAAERRAAADVAAAPDDAEKHARLADIYLSRNEWKKAAKELRTALKLAPDSFEYVGALVEVLQRDGRDAEAEKVGREWLAAHPRSAEAFQARVDALIESGSEEAGKVLDEALAAHPDFAMLHVQRGLVLDRDDDRAGAEKEFVRAAGLAPQDAGVQAWAARFFMKHANHEQAMQYYLRAYFLDPHFHDTEYAEEHIRNLAMELAKARVQGVDVAKLLDESDPVVLELAIDAAGSTWKDEYAAPLIALLGHDVSSVRAQSAMLLGRRLPADDARVAKLLEHEDRRIRGMAAYIAGMQRGEPIVPLMTSWLDDPIELARYDAISVMSMYGGEPGRKALLKARKLGKIKEPRWLALLDSSSR